VAACNVNGEGGGRAHVNKRRFPVWRHRCDSSWFLSASGVSVLCQTLLSAGLSSKPNTST